MTTSTVDNPAQALPDSAPFTPFQVLLGVLTRPRDTFGRMRDAERGHWWVVFAVALIALVLNTVAIVPIEAEAARAASEAQMSGMEGLDEAQRAQVERTQAIFSSAAVLGALNTGAGIAGLLIGYAIRAGVLFVLGMVLGGQAGFKQIWRMSVWTALPLAVGKCISAIAIVATSQLPAAGLTYVLTGAELAAASPILIAILGRIDIYVIWSLVLIAFGMRATLRLSTAKSAMIATAFWLLGAGWAVATTAIGQALTHSLGIG
jgi:hypothetical protein